MSEKNSNFYDQKLLEYFKKQQEVLPKPAFTSDPTTIHKWFYIYKILNVFWFKFKLPNGSSTKIDISFNTEWPQSIPLPKVINGILKMDYDELKFVCGKLIQPTWVSLPQTIQDSYTVIDVYDTLINSFDQTVNE